MQVHVPFNNLYSRQSLGWCNNLFCIFFLYFISSSGGMFTSWRNGFLDYTGWEFSGGVWCGLWPSHLICHALLVFTGKWGGWNWQSWASLGHAGVSKSHLQEVKAKVPIWVYATETDCKLNGGIASWRTWHALIRIWKLFLSSCCRQETKEAQLHAAQAHLKLGEVSIESGK